MDPLPIWRVVLPVAIVFLASLVALLRPVRLLRIVVLCILAMSAYGMIHDQFTARLCPEYFTVLHRPITGLSDPTWLGITWGFLGAWWGGLLLGLLAAAAATLGKWPRLGAGDVLILLILLCVATGLSTLATGVVEYISATEASQTVTVAEPYASLIPAPRRASCYAVAYVHRTAYFTALVGGLVLCAWIVFVRYRKHADGPTL